MSKASNNKDNQSNTFYTVLCAGHEYKTKFKIGDRVLNGSYIKVMIIESVDEYLTSILNQLHWDVVDENYMLGERKTSHAEPVSDNEIEFCV